MIDAGPLGRVTADLMELIERDHPTAELRSVLVIAEVEDGDETVVRWKHNATPATVAGMAYIVATSMTEGEDV